MLSRKTQAIIHHDLIKVLLENTKTNEEFFEAALYALEIITTEIKICNRIVKK